MSNLRTRILGLATMATAFVGLSYGQSVVCNPGTNVLPGATAPTAYTAGATPATGTGVANLGTQINPSLRAESQTEMLAVYQFNCTVVTVGGTTAAPTYTTPTTGSGTTGTIYVTTNLPITSKQVSAGVNEATVIINGSTTVVNQNGQIILGNGIAVQGTVSGTQVTFPLPACTTVAPLTCPIPNYPAVAEVEVTNIRVNASSAGSPQTSESGLLSYVVPNTTGGLITANLGLPAANAPGYILKSLGAPVITGSVNYTTCLGNPLPFVGTVGTAFTVNINQLIPDTFLGVGQPGSLLPGSEVGQYLSGGIGSANADIINLTLSNLPASATVYVPQSTAVYGTGGNTVQLTISGSTASSATGVPAGSVAYTATGGTITIPYTVVIGGIGDQTTQTGLSAITVPVIVSFAANSATAQGPITANYSYGPAVAALTAPPAAIPQFVASTFTAANGSSITNCQTTLLFPFVTNQVGFDTGIAISNTSIDNLGTAGKTIAAAQTGTCQLFFYGTTAPTPAAVADPMGALAAGNTHAFQLSSVAAGYQGYMIANCPFVYARGYAFLFQGSGATAVAQGYLAETLLTRGGTATTTIGDTDQY